MSKTEDKSSKGLNNAKRLLIIGLCSFLIFISSLVVNGLQLVNYLTVRFISLDYYRRINGLLQYVIYSQLVTIAEWWSKSTVNIYFEDEDSRRWFGKEHGLSVANHRYEVDAVYLWMVSARYNILGSVKAFGKKELRFVPIIGWAFFFGEYIFLERNWQKDQENISRGLDRIMEHKDPVMLMIAAEGTRFTQAKHKVSMDYAEEKKLPKFKYHLLPRVKGFAATVRHLKENFPNCSIYNTQLAFDEKSTVSTSNLLKGKPMNGSMYFKRIPISSVPTETDQQIADFLYDIYREKDELMAYHDKHKKFPGIEVPFKRSILPLIVMWTNFLIVGIPLFWLMVKVSVSGNYLLIGILTMFILAVYTGLYFAIRSSKISKGSKYGMNNTSSSDRNSNAEAYTNGKAKHN